MDLMEKLTILADSAKYDVACTSSGVNRGKSADASGMGSATACGICHTFSADGRCVSLLKVLMSNMCVYDCKYCVNRVTNDVPRAAFTPRELADLTIDFYRRNYIEGLFVSSGVIINPNHTTELLIKCLEILRFEYGFRGYIHAKSIPGTEPALVTRLGLLADRMSVNIELPSESSLQTLAPNKTKQAILAPMGQIHRQIGENKSELVKYRYAPKFTPAGQSTQMIVGASPETDYKILNLTENLYKKYQLKRVFFSAYIPVVQHTLLPSLETKPPLLREHRLYQADWLLRFYHFSAAEILSEETPNFNPYLDPKCNWAIHNMHLFPVEINAAPYEMLLRVPGIGVKSAQRIVAARRAGRLDAMALKRIGVVLKRAQYFITCNGKGNAALHATRENTVRALIDPAAYSVGVQQLSLFDTQIQLPVEEAVKCLATAM
ncbi:MAG: putative DNA modification/repair radical SAM protein [Oscillospiraceae bacterium]|nr:putative DNA modification/repair radical SAM protein [Oscillospiraceae bacterium]